MVSFDIRIYSWNHYFQVFSWPFIISSPLLVPITLLSPFWLSLTYFFIPTYCFAFLRLLCKGNHTVYTFALSSFSQRNYFVIHPCYLMDQLFIPFYLLNCIPLYGFITFCLVTCWWTLGCFEFWLLQIPFWILCISLV